MEKCASMRFGDLRASALERFSFGRMAAGTLAAYREALETAKEKTR